MSDVFVEVGRVEHVDRLEQAYRALSADGSARPALISLESRSGYGKTRIVQEFYRRIARDQAYWPSSLVVEHGGAQQARKRIGFSTFTKPQGAALPFMWLALDCELETGIRESGVGSVSQALRNHLPSVFIDGPTRSDAALEVADLLQGVAATVVEDALSSAIPGVGTVVFGYRVVKSRLVRRALERDERGERTIDIDAGAGRSVFGDLVGVHRQRPQLPFILVIEDAHDADRPLIELLRLLLDPEQKSRLPILVVTMAWPDPLVQQEKAARNGDTADSFGQLLVDLNETGVGVDRRKLAPLGDDGLRRIFDRAAPRTTDRVLRALVQHCEGNPYMARLLLDLDDVRASVRSDAIHLDPEHEVPRLPATVADAMRDLWTHLPPDVQWVLELAALQGREFVGALVEHMAHMLPQIPENPRASLAAAVTPHESVRQLDRDVFVFFERYNHELALDAARRSLWAAGSDSAITSYVAEARQDTERWKEFVPQAQDLLLALHVRAAGGQSPASAAESARDLFERKRDWDTSAALRWAEEALDLMRAAELAARDHLDALASSDFLASLKRFAVSHPSLMRELAQSQLRHAELLSEAPSATLVDVIQMAGRKDDAVAMALDLASDDTPADFAKTQLVFVLSDAGRHDEAIALAQQLVEQAATAEERQGAALILIMARVQAGRFGDETGEPLLSTGDRSMEILILMSQGRSDDAIAAARELLREAQSSAERRAAREVLAPALEQADRYDEALTVRREQLAEAQPGAEWRESAEELAVALELAAANERVKDILGPPSRAEDEAIALRRRLLSEARSPDEARDARKSLALALQGTDREDEFLRLRRELFADARLPDEVRNARKDLIEALSQAKRWHESIPLLEEQLAAAASPAEGAACERALKLARGRPSGS
jgi:hypothetical protein